MTEQEWRESSNPQEMLTVLQRRKVSNRKFRLFAVACCRHVSHLFPDDPSKKAVELAEKYADGKGSMYKLGAARKRAGTSLPALEGQTAAYNAALETVWGIEAAAWDDTVAWPTARSGAIGGLDAATKAARCIARATAFAADETWYDPPFSPAMKDAKSATEEYLAKLLRCVLGNPFRPVPPRTGAKRWNEELRRWLTWNNSTVTALAQAIYDERAFDRMPILADALEDAGCANQELLGYCRGEGTHFRGCWALDLVLGKK